MDAQLLYAVFPGFFILYWAYNKLSSKGPVPPGPRPLPVIGNVFDLPTSELWMTFDKWKSQYGDLVYFRAFNSSYLIINTLESVTALLEKRGSIYSHRPKLVMLGKLMGLDRSMALYENNENFRYHRKLAHAALGSVAIKRYWPLQERTAIQLIASLLEEPQNFIDLFRLSAGRIVVSVTYGFDVESAEDPYVADAEKTLKLISDALAPNAAILDHFPFLQYIPSWFPFAGFKKHAARSRKQIEELVSSPFDAVRKEMAEGKTRPSFVYDMMSAHDEEDHTDEERKEFAETVKWNAGTMYGAGAETTYLTMNCFVMVMAMHPDKQAKAKAEVDQLLRGQRLPVCADRPDMPYVEALIYETLRWHVALPYSIPRRTAKADEYKGYYIPEGTVVLPNVWSIAREEYDDSDEFLPERFLGKGEPTYVFGFGRRLCPGRLLAMNSLFVMIASMLASFDITNDVDERGDPIPIQPTYQDGLISFPEKFRAKITPRSREAVDLIKSASLPQM